MEHGTQSQRLALDDVVALVREHVAVFLTVLQQRIDVANQRVALGPGVAYGVLHLLVVIVGQEHIGVGVEGLRGVVVLGQHVKGGSGERLPVKAAVQQVDVDTVEGGAETVLV